MDAETLSNLIGDIYQCAIEPRRWDDTLTHMVSAFAPADWDVAVLMSEHMHGPGIRFVGTTGVGVLAREAYAAVFSGRNPWSRLGETLRVGEVVDTDALLPRNELLASDFYKNFLSAWNMELAVTVVLDRTRDEQLALVMPGRDGRSLASLKRGLRLIAPHIQRAARLSYHLTQAQLRASAAEAALNLSHVAVLALREDLSIVSANEKSAALAHLGLLRLDGGRLTLNVPDAQNELALLARAQPPASAAFKLKVGGAKPWLVLALKVFPQRCEAMSGWVEGASILVSISLPETTPLLEIDRLRAWYDLTASEAKLTAALAAGSTLQSYVDQRGVTVDAARFLLKGVFRKVGVESQAQLISRVRALPSA